MANVTGAELNPIYQRLNQVPTYHPFEANAFSDWSMEAGDMVVMMRDGEEYKSPVTVSRMVWKGNAPTVQISSTGNKEREPVSRISRKKYGRGSAGIRSQEAIHKNFTSEDGILHSELHVTESYLRTEFHEETHSLRSYVDLTASHLQTAFIDEAHSLRSYVDLTASHLETVFADDVNSLRGDFEVTVSHMRTEFTDDVNSLRGDFEVTSSHMRTEFTDGLNSVRSYTYQTASSWEARVAPVTDANGNVTPASIALAVNNSGSSVKINADKIYLLGQTILNTVNAEHISSQIAEIPHLYTHHITMDGDLTLGGRLTLLGVNVTSLVSSVKSVRISDPINNTYKLQYTTYDDDSWQDAGSFSRATTLTGVWGGTVAAGKTFVVTATPQGNVEGCKIYGSIVPDSSDPVEYTTSGNNHYVAQDHIIFTEDDNGDADVQILKKEVKISADLAYSDGYTTGYEEGAASGGTTTLTNTWNTGHLVVTASPQSVTLDRWLSSGTASWNGTTVSIPINALFGNSQQYSESTGWSASADVSGKLQSKTFTSNGTKTPDSGYIGFSSVSVNVAGADARAHFGATSGQYYIEAVDTVSGNQIPGSTVNYTLGYSGSNIVINAGSGQATPTLALGISSGTLDTSTGSRTLTVTAGGNNTTATTTITDYSAGKNAVTVSSVAVNGTITYSSKVLTVPTTATASNNATKTVNLSVDATLAYNAGWTAYYQKWHYPTSGTGTSMSVYWPSSTADSAYDSIERKYTLENKDNNTVYLRYSSTTYAQLTHGKYDAGWGAARTSTGDFPTAAVAEANRAQYITVKRPNSTVGGTATSYSYYVTSDNNKAYIKYSGTTGNIIAQVTHNKYNAGWAAAYAKVSLPANNTSSGYMVVKTPPSTVDGNATETTYTLDTSNNNVAYIKNGSSIKAQVTHNKYNAGYNANRSGWIAYGKGSATSNQGYLGEGNYIHAYTVDINGTAHDSAGFWWIPTAWFRYVNGAGSNHQGDLASDSYIELIYTNSNASGDVRGTGATWHVPSGGGSTSHSISQNHAYADNLATLASNLGASGSSALTNLGTFPAAGGRNYWGIKVKCGSAVKYYYVHTT